MLYIHYHHGSGSADILVILDLPTLDLLCYCIEFFLWTVSMIV